MSAVQPGRVMGRLCGELGDMPGGDEAASEEGLLVFAVQHEDFHQAILNRLQQ